MKNCVTKLDSARIEGVLRHKWWWWWKFENR